MVPEQPDALAWFLRTGGTKGGVAEGRVRRLCETA